jgi:beta-lactamase regulating signal transducer with metallopeptidase domain
MSAWLDVAASNIALATLLTAVAWALARWTRQPALVHTLCVLALLKLVTPPLFAWPVLPAEAAAPEPDFAAWSPAELEAALALPAAAAEPPAPVLTPLTVALGLWLLGACAMLLVTWVRGRRFARLLDAGKAPSPALAHEIAGLAARLGLRQAPEVTVAPGRVSPMVWPSPRGLRLVLPASLLHELRPEQRTALLLHELAHVRRGDHWVRRLETAVSALFWWLPTLWWLRACLRDAEEQCCDAWVVWAMPARERAYADALLKTVDFLSGPCLALPPQASGAGHLQHLKRRLTMIMEATTPRKLGAAGRTAVATLAVLFLPLLPTRAQDPERDDAARAEAKEEAVRAALERLEKIESKLEKIAERHGDGQQDDGQQDDGQQDDDAEDASAADRRTLREHHAMIREHVHKAMEEAKAGHMRALSKVHAFGELNKAKMSEDVDEALGAVRRAMSSGAMQKALEEARRAHAEIDLDELKRHLAGVEKMRAKRALEVAEQARHNAFGTLRAAHEDHDHDDDAHEQADADEGGQLRARPMRARRAARAGEREHRIEELKAQIDALQQDMKKLTAELRRLQREDGDEESTR